jgi:hypothetical protein
MTLLRRSQTSSSNGLRSSLVNLRSTVTPVERRDFGLLEPFCELGAAGVREVVAPTEPEPSEESACKGAVPVSESSAVDFLLTVLPLTD